MIGQVEIDVRARQLGLLPSHVAKDYVLNHVLAAIARLQSDLVFRGGTALARVYWPDFRISEDLDFIAAAPRTAFRPHLSNAVAAAAAESGIELDLAFVWLREGWTRAEVRSAEVGTIQLDINQGEAPTLAPQTRPLTLPYSDLAARSHSIAVVEVDEILADKWAMLTDRQEPRDLFDLWTGVCLQEVPVGSIAKAFHVKYGGSPGSWRVDRAAPLKATWEKRLALQLKELPPFDEVLGQVLARIQAWEASRSAPGGKTSR